MFNGLKRAFPNLAVVSEEREENDQGYAEMPNLNIEVNLISLKTGKQGGLNDVKYSFYTTLCADILNTVFYHCAPIFVVSPERECG